MAETGEGGQEGARKLAGNINRLLTSTVILIAVSKPVIASTSKSQLSGSCLDSLDAELRKMIQQVLDVLPQVPVSAVKQDLGTVMTLTLLILIFGTYKPGSTQFAILSAPFESQFLAFLHSTKEQIRRAFGDN